MLVISHRGLLDGPDKKLENHPDQIKLALSEGFEVEIDLQIENGLPFLGHDGPTYSTTVSFLCQSKLWIHAKTMEAANFASKFLGYRNWFFHQNDDCIVLNKKLIWTYPKKELPLYDHSIAVLPELNYTDEEIKAFTCYGICTDYARKFK
jgi:hypothetical protein